MKIFSNLKSSLTKEKWSWILYDAGNSAFSTTIMVAILPTFYFDVAASNLEPHQRTANWGYINSIGLLIISLIAPILGALADKKGFKKGFLAIFTGLGILASIALYWIGKGDWVPALICYLIGYIGFAGAEVFYESLLPHVASEKDIHKVSSMGYAIGYFGGGILLLLNILWFQFPEAFGFSNKISAISASFVSVGIWWGLFSVPLFKNIPEPKSPMQNDNISLIETLKKPFTTLKSVKKYPQTFLFLVAFWAYSDAIGTIMKMSSTFGKEVGLETGSLIAAILMVQFLGVPFAYLFGEVATKIGVKTGIQITLVTYCAICVIGYFMVTELHFWLLAFLVATVQGGAQSLSRSLFSQLIPKKFSSEFFGFFATSAKMAGVIGPLMFGVLSQYTGSSRFSILALLVFLIIGMFLLSRVDIEKGIRDAST